MERTRIDRWLWASRLYKTRGEATEACRGGHVRLNGRPVKAAATVSAGDRLEVRVHGRDRDLEITTVIEKRVGAAVAAECYVDHSPPVPERERLVVADRQRGAGRPTKRERRETDRLRGRGR